MPRVYVRKNSGSPRAAWTEEALQKATTRIRAGEIGIREAHRLYGVHETTLRRRLKIGDFSKGSLGPGGVLGKDNEKVFIAYVERAKKLGFRITQKIVKKFAFQFAESRHITHRFNRQKQEAGLDWLRSFMSRNPEFTIRSTTQNVTAAQGLTQKVVDEFYDLYGKFLREQNLLRKPSNVFNVAETLISTNVQLTDILGDKHSEFVELPPRTKTAEEFFTLIACSNAEGKYLPPVVIIKNVTSDLDFKNGLPPGSDVYTNPQKGLINSELFLKWFKEIFLPAKSQGNTILILDQYASSCCSMELLTAAEENDVTMLCLPANATSVLQPFQLFFDSLKNCLSQLAQATIIENLSTVIFQQHIGQLLGEAWNQTATATNCICGFKETGIFPFNRDAISNDFLTVGDDNLSKSPENPVASTSMILAKDIKKEH